MWWSRKERRHSGAPRRSAVRVFMFFPRTLGGSLSCAVTPRLGSPPQAAPLPRQEVVKIDCPSLPSDLPVFERSAVRVVVIDTHERVLLFHTRDVDHPDLGEWWELPGGGIDPGETYLEAAVRELREETGIVAEPSRIRPANWRRRASFRHRQRRHLQDEVIVALHLDEAGPDVDESNRLDYELEDYFAFRWWPFDEIRSSHARFCPGRLPELLTPFLRGDAINEPFELWS